MRGVTLRGPAHRDGLARARQWREDNRPYFDAIYGPDPDAPRPLSSGEWARSRPTPPPLRHNPARLPFSTKLAIIALPTGLAWAALYVVGALIGWWA